MVPLAEEMNPSMPVFFDLTMVAVWILGAAALVAIAWLLVSALVQIARARHLDETGRAIWVLIVIIAPLLGAAAWHLIGSRPRSLAP